jgi:hypothetical protein
VIDAVGTRIVASDLGMQRNAVPIASQLYQTPRLIPIVFAKRAFMDEADYANHVNRIITARSIPRRH